MSKHVVFEYEKYEFQILRKHLSEDVFRVERPSQAVDLFASFADNATKESLFVMSVDGRNGLIGISEVYRGTATGTSVRVAELLTPVLLTAGVGMVLIHNHPSGDAAISNEDAKLTYDVIRAAKLMDIEFLDHLVIGRNDFKSIRSENPSMWDTERESA